MQHVIPMRSLLHHLRVTPLVNVPVYIATCNNVGPLPTPYMHSCTCKCTLICPECFGPACAPLQGKACIPFLLYSQVYKRSLATLVNSTIPQHAVNMSLLKHLNCLDPPSRVHNKIVAQYRAWYTSKYTNWMSGRALAVGATQQTVI